MTAHDRTVEAAPRAADRRVGAARRGLAALLGLLLGLLLL